MKTPHKHAELIKAWADGAQIEYKYSINQCWQASHNPKWRLDAEYRVKPVPMLSSKAVGLIDFLLGMQRDRYMIYCDSPQSASAMFEAREELEEYILGLEAKP